MKIALWLTIALLICNSTIQGFETNEPLNVTLDEEEDQTYLTFRMYELENDDMANCIQARAAEDEQDLNLLVDISSFMTIIFAQEVQGSDTLQYRGNTYKAEVKTITLSTYGFNGSDDSEEPEIKEYYVDLEVAYIVLSP